MFSLKRHRREQPIMVYTGGGTLNDLGPGFDSTADSVFTNLRCSGCLPIFAAYRTTEICALWLIFLS